VAGGCEISGVANGAAVELTNGLGVTTGGE